MFSWPFSILAMFMYTLSGLGITAGAHRLWAHRSYKAKWPLRVILMIFNTIAFQDAAMHWARDHRVHHKYSETDAGKSLNNWCPKEIILSKFSRRPSQCHSRFLLLPCRMAALPQASWCQGSRLEIGHFRLAVWPNPEIPSEILPDFDAFAVLHRSNYDSNLLLGRILEKRLLRRHHVPLHFHLECHLVGQLGGTQVGR